MPLEILFVCSWYPHADSPSNGIFIRRHAQSLALQHKVTVVFAKASEQVTTEETSVRTEGNLTEIICLYPRVNSPIPFWRSILRLRRYTAVYESLIRQQLAAKRFDLLHVQVVFPAAVPLLRVLSPMAPPVFVTEHWSGYYPEDGNYKGIYLKRITQKLIARARAICVISEKLTQAMLAQGLAGNYHLVHNAVDTGVFKPSAKTASPVLRILHVSSLVEREKNILGILEVMSLLKAQQRPFSLTVVGGDEETIAYYKNRAAEKGLREQVHFAGHADPATVAAHMNAADVFLLLSHFEGMPVVLLEAMACGLPVVSTPVGAVPSMVPEGFGTVLPNADAEVCARILNAYRRETYSTPEQMHAGIHAQYGYEAVCRQHTAIYHTYLN